jgi:hypothetical protein
VAAHIVVPEWERKGIGPTDRHSHGAAGAIQEPLRSNHIPWPGVEVAAHVIENWTYRQEFGTTTSPHETRFRPEKQRLRIQLAYWRKTRCSAQTIGNI